jgi:hypothetical protein
MERYSGLFLISDLERLEMCSVCGFKLKCVDPPGRFWKEKRVGRK